MHEANLLTDIFISKRQKTRNDCTFECNYLSSKILFHNSNSLDRFIKCNCFCMHSYNRLTFETFTMSNISEFIYLMTSMLIHWLFLLVCTKPCPVRRKFSLFYRYDFLVQRVKTGLSTK